MPENLNYSRVGTWTMENVEVIAHKFNRVNDGVFEQLLTTFISAINAENDDPNRADDTLAFLFTSFIAKYESGGI